MHEPHRNIPLLHAGRRISRVAYAAATAAGALALAACGEAPAANLPTSVPAANTAAAAANAITVSPLPGTSDASPSTQISFLGGAGTTVSNVTVTGSRSGRHGGRLEAYSTGTGESFLPSHRFAAGETVNVSARVSGGAANGKTVRTTFAIAYQAPISQKQFPRRAGNAADVQHYLSAPSLTPSIVRITTPAQPGASPGDLFLAPYQGAGTAGPMIASQAGNLIWFDPLAAADSATNFRPQTYDGRTVLTWWQGRVLQLGFGQGEDEIYSTSYRPLAVVRAGNGYRADLHEFLVTPQGTAWIDAFDPVRLNLTHIGGLADAYVNDSIVEEIDIKTGLVMWEWHAFGHIPLADSYSAVPHTNNWDYVHINSIDPRSADDLLLSARNTWTLYDVDLQSGAIQWRIGGTQSTFTLGPGVKFFWQHDAMWEPGGLISVFDNGSSPPEETQSRGLLLSPDLATHSVALVKAFTNPSRTLLASSQGDVLDVGGGNWLMGYGGLPDFTEYNSAGDVLLDGSLGLNVQDFRSYMAPWSGQPQTKPSVAAQAASSGSVTVEASWNGATTVSAWRLLAGRSATSLHSVGTTNTTGFQTTMSAGKSGPYVEVVALGSGGQTLTTSRVVKAKR
ncbi:MAG TPA: arylsulfotransferase family protein [Solirubrobacteraceae bacterium]|nr:arylsulfotransferase family protein [Solirubrobacteraceae bacterium]